MNALNKNFWILATVMAASAASAGLSAAPMYPQPTYGTATVDGDSSEWNLSTDFFVPMYRAGNPTKPVESKLYLRYNVAATTLFALVLTESSSLNVLPQPDDAFIKLGNSTTLVNGSDGNDGTPPDFAWVPDTATCTGSTGCYDGFEASAILGLGDYDNLNVHIQVFSDNESQTSAVEGRAVGISLVDNPVPPPIPPEPSDVPVPATLALLGLGLFGFGARRRRT